jgi:hypothetical protein
MDKLSVADLQRMFERSLIEYEGVIYYIDRIYDSEEITLLNPLSQKQRIVKFVREKFIHPGIPGFVNGNDEAVYFTRIPRRIYYVGLSNENIRVVGLGGDIFNRISLHKPAIVFSLMDVYPSLEEALLLIKEKRSVAFNKHFAVDKHQRIFYKTSHVGNVVNGEIVFLNGKEFLQNLFRTEDVKNIRKTWA